MGCTHDNPDDDDARGIEPPSGEQVSIPSCLSTMVDEGLAGEALNGRIDETIVYLKNLREKITAQAHQD